MADGQDEQSSLDPETGAIARFENLLLLSPLNGRVDTPTQDRWWAALDRETGEDLVFLRQAGMPGQQMLFDEWVERATGQSFRGMPRVLAGTLVGSHYQILVERARGLPLTRLIQEGALSRLGATSLLEQVASILTDLHQAGALHGDLHPGNVLVTPKGSVVLVGSAPPPIGGTETRIPAATRAIRYGAPEWYQRADSGAPGDLFSLGLIAIEAFTGIPLVPPRSAEEARTGIEGLAFDLPKVLGGIGEIPVPIRDLIPRLLSTDPDARPRAEDFRAALHTIQGSRTRGLRDLAARQKATRRKRVSRSLERLPEIETADPLERATLIRDALEGGDISRSQRGRARKILSDELWKDIDADPKGSHQVVRREASLLQLHRAASDLGSGSLARLVQARIGRVARRHGLLENLLPEPIDPRALEEDLRRILARLDEDPYNDEYLLAYAVYRTDEVGRSILPPQGAEGTRNARKADLLSGLGLLPAALHHLALDLPDPAHTDEAMAAIRKLVRASDSGGNAPAPLSMPPRRSAPSTDVWASEPPPRPEARSAPSEVHDELVEILRSENPNPPPEGAEAPEESPRSHISVVDIMEQELGFAASDEVIVPAADAAAAATSTGGLVGRPSLFELEKAGTPSASATEAQDPEVLSSPDFTSPEVLTARFQTHLLEGEYEHAALMLETLEWKNHLESPTIREPVRKDLLRALWSQLLPWVSPTSRMEALLQLRDVAVAGRILGLLPLVDTLLVRTERVENRIELLSGRALRETATPPLLLALLQELEDSSRPAKQAERLIALGWEFLTRSEILEACRAFARARALVGDLEQIRRGVAEAFTRGRRLEAATEDHRALRDQFDSGEVRGYARVHALDGFTTQYPFFLPGLVLAATVLEEEGEERRAARFQMDAARRYLVRCLLGPAREHLVEALRLDRRLDEAALWLAAIDSPPEGNFENVGDLRNAILERAT